MGPKIGESARRVLALLFAGLKVVLYLVYVLVSVSIGIVRTGQVELRSAQECGCRTLADI